MRIHRSMESFGPTLLIEIPVRPFWYRVPFFTFLILVWAGIELMLIQRLWSTHADVWGLAAPFLQCAAISVLGLALIAFYVWMLSGREVIRVTQSAVELSNELGTFSWSKVYESQRIGIIHVTPPAQASWHNARYDPLGPGAFKHGEIEFDYDTTSYRFGFDLERKSVDEVLSAISEVLPAKVMPF